MEVAFATTDGRLIDEHFGRAGRFAILDFTPEGYTALPDLVFADGRDAAVESTRGRGDAHDEAVGRKVEQLGDCRLVYLTAIGGPSAARMARRGIMPVKVAEGAAIEEAAEKLMTTIRTAPPPWLRRALSPHANETLETKGDAP
jgi:nitrogen fixation protein NifX